MEHHTKTKGDIGVLKVQADAAEQGWTVMLPLTEHSAFDIVIYREGIFKRVQVKYRSAKKGSLHIAFQSIWSDRKGTHRVKANKDNIDLYAVYCPDTNKCYYFSPKNFKTSVSLRINKPANGQELGINFADKFRTIASIA